MNALHEQEAALEEEEERLLTTEDVAEVLGEEGERPLIIPEGMKVVVMAPADEKLDSLNDASAELEGATIFVRFEDFGWCKGTLLKRNTDRRRTIKGMMVNFIAKFDIDEDTTAVKLEAKDYDTAAFADYESWLLLEPEAEAAAEADA